MLYQINYLLSRERSWKGFDLESHVDRVVSLAFRYGSAVRLPTYNENSTHLTYAIFIEENSHIYMYVSSYI